MGGGGALVEDAAWPRLGDQGPADANAECAGTAENGANGAARHTETISRPNGFGGGGGLVGILKWCFFGHSSWEVWGLVTEKASTGPSFDDKDSEAVAAPGASFEALTGKLHPTGVLAGRVGWQPALAFLGFDSEFSRACAASIEMAE